ncbi:MAG: hypothetical protein WCI18_16555 [Pseudomonadota bacterium]
MSDSTQRNSAAAKGLQAQKKYLQPFILNLSLASALLTRSPFLWAFDQPQGLSKAAVSTQQPETSKAVVSFPATPENVRYLLKYSLNRKKYLIKSREAKFEVPVKAKIFALTAVRNDGTIAREYSIVPLNKQLLLPQSQESTPILEQAEPEEIDSNILSSYEIVASNSEMTSSKKIAEDEQNEIRRTDLEARVGLKIIKFHLKSSLGAESLNGSSLLLSPTYELAQSFLSNQTIWSVGLGGTFAKLELNQASQKATGMFIRNYLYASAQVAPQFTVRAALNFLKTPELAEVIKEIDDSEQATISAYSRVSPSFRAEYQPVESVELGLELRPYISGGGGYGYSLDGAHKWITWQKIRGYLGAEYDSYRLKRKGQCSGCTDDNTSEINQLSLTLQGRMPL